MCDFWCFEAANEDPAQVLVKLKGLLLEAEFTEIKSGSPTEALTLLRSKKVLYTRCRLFLSDSIICDLVLRNCNGYRKSTVDTAANFFKTEDADLR